MTKPISSQAPQECGEGSETRTRSPDRAVKSHECAATCKTCKEVKPKSEFGKDARLRSGVRSECKVCSRLRTKRWREENPDKVQEYKKRSDWSQRWVKYNPEKRREASRAYYARNRDAHAERVKAWNEKNQGKRRAITMSYRAAKMRATSPWYSELDDFVLSELHSKASLLESLGHGKFHVDHIVPLQGKTVCGLHCKENWQLLGASENVKKSNRLMI